MHSMEKIVADWKQAEAKRQKNLRPYVKPEILRGGGKEAEPADLPEDEPETKPEKLSYSVEDQVRMRLSGMRTKDVATVCHVAPATVSANVSYFKKAKPERYAELVAEYEKPVVEVTEGNP